MGTTLSFTGAYNLAGSLLRHNYDPATSFAAYEAKMRPIVTRAQKLVPGAPRIFCPATERGVARLRWFGYLIKVSQLTKVIFGIVWLLNTLGLASLLAKIGPSQADAVWVDNYGFRAVDEWNGQI
jgi:hypothetical protein